MIKEEDLIIDIRSLEKDILGEFYRVEITHEPTGESITVTSRSVKQSRESALEQLQSRFSESTLEPFPIDLPEDILDEVLKLKISPEAIENNLYSDDFPPNPPLPWNGKDASND